MTQTGDNKMRNWYMNTKYPITQMENASCTKLGTKSFTKLVCVKF